MTRPDAVMSRGEITAARAAAVGRVKARHSGEYRTHTEQERREAWVRGEELTPHDWTAPAVRPPENLAGWIDDRVTEWSQMPHGEGALLVTVLEAARDSTAAGVKALKAARTLTPAQQFAVYQNLQAWRTDDRAGRLGAEHLARALLAEWTRLKLPAEDPAQTEQPARRKRRWEIEAEATA